MKTTNGGNMDERDEHEQLHLIHQRMEVIRHAYYKNPVGIILGIESGRMDDIEDALLVIERMIGIEDY